MDEQLRDIKQGATFNRKGAGLGFFLFMMMGVGAVASLIQGFWWSIPVFLVLAASFFEYFRSRRGVLVDIEMGRVKRYVQFFWFKQGKWMDIDIFDRLILIKDYYSWRSGLATTVWGPGARKRGSSYDVILINEHKEHDMLLVESSSHPKAKMHLKELAAFLGYPAEDRLQATIDKLQARRRKGGRY